MNGGSELRNKLEKLHHASYAWALRCCAFNPSEAEDVLQTVYLKILEGRATYEGKSAFKTWFFAVIRKTAAEARRRKYFRQVWLNRYEDHIANDDLLEQIEDEDEQYELQRLFTQALSTLPRRQQETLELVFYHDLTIKEAAEVMGVSIGSARTHYDRGKKQLRSWLEKSKVWHETKLG